MAAPKVPDDLIIPPILVRGTPMTKISTLSKRYTFSIDAEHGVINYHSSRGRSIPIESIREIRTGADCRYHRKEYGMSEKDETRWLSITYLKGDTYKMLHLIADDDESFKLWRETLTKMITDRQGLMQGLGQLDRRQALWFKQYWKKANGPKPDNQLDFKEIQQLANYLNVGQSQEQLKALFKQAKPNDHSALDFEGFKRFIELLDSRPEIDLIFKNALAKDTQVLDSAMFQKFLVETQGVDPKAAPSIFDRYAKPGSGETKYVDLKAFKSFLLSEDNSPFKTLHEQVHQDMTQPISSYYIFSSHNTYLVGHQLVGVSTVEGYIRALLLGCRSVELDIYDGDDDEEPMIYHGGTLTSKVSLRDICEAVNKYAFVVSKYPVIISAEVHCGLAKQEQIYRIMTEIFGTKLIQAPVSGRPKLAKLPSPEEMKEKIMLKAKNLIVAHELEQSRGETPSQQPAVLVADLDESSSESEKEGGGLVHGLLSKIKRKPKTSSEKPKMSFALASLLVYTVGVKCRGFDKTTYSPEHIFSLSESSGKKICGTEGFLKHAQTHLVRTYPKGLRVSSSNYLPHTFWACGAQLVAINVQTFGHFALMMNWASFKRNGRAGYLLKPSPLRAETLEPLRKMHRYRFNCTVISGQHLPRPRNEDGKEDTSNSLMDPYVQITIHVPDWSINKVSGETETHLTPKAINFSTKIVHNNGFSPQWNEECSLGFECAADEMLDLVFVHFQVKLKGDDDDDIPVAQYCSPLSEVEKGYRHLPLHDSQLSQFLYSTLLVKMNVGKA